MIVIPINTEHETLIVLVIEPDNLERMKQGDPITLTALERGGYLNIQHPDNYQLIVAYEEDPKPLYEMAKNNDVIGIVKHIQRGYKYVKGLDGIAMKPITTEVH